MDFCKKKKMDESTHLIRQTMEAGLQGSENYGEELLVTGTDLVTWVEVWHVSTLFKQHYAGNLSQFKRIKISFGVERMTHENKILFIKGLRDVGNIAVTNHNEELIKIPGVFYNS